MTIKTAAWRRMASLLFVLALVATACSGSSTTTISDTATSNTAADTSEQEPEPTAVPESTAVPAATETPVEPTAPPEPTPTPEPVYFSTGIEPGDCFNRLEGNPPLTPPDKVSCDGLHDEEVYAKALLDDGPDAPYPGEDAVADRVSAELCNDATVAFAGATWDNLAMNTLLLFPLEEDWAAGDRNIMCSARSSVDDERKIGTAAGGTLRTDDVLLTRAAIVSDGESFDDWLLMKQNDGYATAGSLTDGQFDLPLRPAFQIPRGFMFNAKPAGDEGHATTTWGYDWDAQEFTDLGSILPGQELASTMVVDGQTIFAARATPEDDLDLRIVIDGEVEVLAGGDGDQRFPTVTPDGQRVLYQDGGDIWIVDIDGSNKRQLTTDPATEWESTVSPDGSTVLFITDRDGDDEIYAMSIDGDSEPVNISNHPGDEFWPVFSADGEHIYFGTDRLDPINNRGVLMVMNADGSNQTWFGSVSSSQPSLVPAAIAADVLNAAPTLNERYSYELLEGDAGTTVSWTHSSGRLTAELPAEWRVGELDPGGVPGFVSGPKIDAYYEVWEVDGLVVNLWDDYSQDDFFALYQDSPAVLSCEQFDGTEGIVPLDADILILTGNFDCGNEDAVGGVIAMYNTETRVGVLIEGQSDSLPDRESDAEKLTAIVRTLIWE